MLLILMVNCLSVVNSGPIPLSRFLTTRQRDMEQSYSLNINQSSNYNHPNQSFIELDSDIFYHPNHNYEQSVDILKDNSLRNSSEKPSEESSTSLDLSLQQMGSSSLDAATLAFYGGQIPIGGSYKQNISLLIPLSSAELESFSKPQHGHSEHYNLPKLSTPFEGPGYHVIKNQDIRPHRYHQSPIKEESSSIHLIPVPILIPIPTDYPHLHHQNKHHDSSFSLTGALAAVVLLPLILGALIFPLGFLFLVINNLAILFAVLRGNLFRPNNNLLPIISTTTSTRIRKKRSALSTNLPKDAFIEQIQNLAYQCFDNLFP